MRLAPTELSGSEIRECTLCRRFRCFLVILAAVISILARPTDSICAAGEGLIPITLPEGKAGIGFDDLGFSSTLHKVLVPSGRTGTLDLVDPDTKQVSSIRGFTGSSRFGGGHGQGITSVDEGRGLLFVTDRTAGLLDVVDPKTRSVIASTRLASGPDYVRFVAETNEIWVTQPGAQRIEVFSSPRQGTPKPAHMRFIAVPGGPESLIIDHGHWRAYTHLWRGVTVAIQLKDHSIVARWPNGCEGSRGIALDERRGFLFVACDEGRLSVLDSNTGKILGTAVSGNGVDIIAYNPKLQRVYLPGEESATMAIIGISSAGSATVLKTVQTVEGAHCATADDRDQVYICDPSKGRLLVFKDFPGAIDPKFERPLASSVKTGGHVGVRMRVRMPARPQPASFTVASVISRLGIASAGLVSREADLFVPLLNDKGMLPSMKRVVRGPRLHAQL